jgi:hypothetical protein
LLARDRLLANGASLSSWRAGWVITERASRAIAVIVGDAPDVPDDLLELARRIAEAEIDAMRVPRARTDLLRRALSGSADQTPLDRQDPRDELEQLRGAAHLMKTDKLVAAESSEAVVGIKEENAPAESVRGLDRLCRSLVQ